MIDCRDNLLVLELLPGVPLADVVERGDYEPEALAAALCDWFAAFYAAMPGLTRGDVNGRNFLWDGTRMRGVDFEECPPGPPAHDAGRLAAFVDTYDTRRRDRQAALAEAFSREFGARFGCAWEDVAARREQELLAMQKRRAAGR